MLYYQNLMASASSYEQWHAAALELDRYLLDYCFMFQLLMIYYRLEGKEAWKDDPRSPDYDFELIHSRLDQMRRARETGDIGSILFLLRTSLSRNLGEAGNPLLYTKTRVGTKRLIEDYIDEAVRNFNWICDAPQSLCSLSLNEKLDFFLNTRQAFGRTALLLSGGATLGLNHVGVIKALHECRLLPRIISGSSIGSLIAALVCSKSDHELLSFIRDEALNLNALESPDEQGSLFFKISRFIKHGVFFDVEVLKKCIRANIGDITFQEAYNRTRRILNITVSSSTKYEMPRLLNYLTAPNVLIWSAVAASCAIPFMYKSAPLMARDKLGNIVPWNPSGHRWIDGSVENDLPMLRLSEMFNVNHFIVCQVNPHVVPFLQASAAKESSLVRSVASTAFFLVKSEIQHRIDQLIQLNIFPTALHHVRNILSQKYDGDITILPSVGIRDYTTLVTNPTRETLWDAVMRGERAAWPQMSIIRNHCQIEMELDECIYRLRCMKLEHAWNVTSAVTNSPLFQGKSGRLATTMSPRQARVAANAASSVASPDKRHALLGVRDMTAYSSASSMTGSVFDDEELRQQLASTRKQRTRTHYGPLGYPAANMVISSTGAVGFEFEHGETLGANSAADHELDFVGGFDALGGGIDESAALDEENHAPPRRVRSEIKMQDLLGMKFGNMSMSMTAGSSSRSAHAGGDTQPAPPTTQISPPTPPHHGQSLSTPNSPLVRGATPESLRMTDISLSVANKPARKQSSTQSESDLRQ